MATANKKAARVSTQATTVQVALSRYLPLEKTFREAWKLALRFQEAEGFREYLRRRMPLVVPAAALFVLISIACAAATVIFLADRHPLLALPALILAPFVLIGSLFVQAFVFFSWLENRAIAHALGRRKKTDFDFGQMPRVPWGLAALFLVLPLIILMAVSTTTGVMLLAFTAGIVGVFARFDR